MESLASRVSAFCKRHRLQLNTDLGQHFLIDESTLDAIIDAAQIQSTDHIVEIGPGIGVLTLELLRKTSHVTSIEIDRNLIPLLRDFLEKSEVTNQRINELTIIQNNALQVPFPSTPYKIVANIPYHITSPLLRHAFLESAERPLSLTLLIQREVAEKICDTKDAGLLTIIVGLFGSARMVKNVPPGCFLPPPKVDSAVLHIDVYKEPLADRNTLLAVMNMAKLGFSQKRKMLRNTLGSLPDGMARLEQAGIDATRRPQTLTLEEWIRLTKTGSPALPKLKSEGG